MNDADLDYTIVRPGKFMRGPIDYQRRTFWWN